jgi:hypothetical protein
MTNTYASEEDAQRFARSFNDLALSKSGTHDDAEMLVYFKELRMLPIEAVEAAARELKLNPGPFLPDMGTWYRLADKIAAEGIEKDAQREVQALPAARHIEESEIERVRAARDDFVARMETLTGRILPPDHPMKSPDIPLPTYACSVCRDVGWVKEDHGDRVRHCVCWETNTVIQQQRARATLRKARSRVG